MTGNCIHLQKLVWLDAWGTEPYCGGFWWAQPTPVTPHIDGELGTKAWDEGNDTPEIAAKKTGMQEPHWNFLPTVDEDLVYVRWRYQRWISNLHCMILSIESVVFTTRHHSPRRRPKWTSQRPERVETFGTFKELGYVWSWLVNQPPLII